MIPEPTTHLFFLLYLLLVRLLLSLFFSLIDIVVIRFYFCSCCDCIT